MHVLHKKNNKGVKNEFFIIIIIIIAMDEIFDNLEKQILKSPKNTKEYCRIAKEQLEHILSVQNYNIFEKMIKELKPVETEE